MKMWLEELQQLVEKTKGERSISKFSRDSDVSRPYLSQILNGKIDNPPRPQILKKISKNSKNRVEYKNLMSAAGHLEGIYYTEKSKNKIEKSIQKDAELYEFWEEIKENESLQLLFKQTRNLSDQAIKDVVRFMKSVEDEISNK